jgi:UDP-2,4-diacetamido-2,4,6-trideoxy-beta-L-altropyranose hydrolase
LDRQKIIFRVDASQTIGRGHLSRCLALAEMIDNHAEVIIVGLAENKNFLEGLNIRYQVINIASDHDLMIHLDRDTILCIDGYNFDPDLISVWKQHAHILIEINDFPDRVTVADVIINQTPALDRSMFQVQEDTKLLLGLDYTLLRKDFLDKSKVLTKYIPDQTSSGIFVCFGGADPMKIGASVVNGLLQAGFTDPIYWVTTSTHDKGLAGKFDNLHMLYELSSDQMIMYMSKSKIIMIPSSVLSFEAIALRKPIHTCYFVDNQEYIFKGLIKQGLAHGYGLIVNDIDKSTYVEQAVDFYNNEVQHKEQIKNQIRRLDGKSGKRIKNILLK